ncbi:MAG TPA: SDR family oxidoreductase [Pseudonocardia sp.]
MTGRLRGRSVLVVGGANGMGAAQAHRCAAEGADVVVADIEVGPANAVAEDIAAAGMSAVACGLDVRDPEQWRSGLELAERAFGRPVTGMVNNAAIGDGRTIERLDPDRFRAVFEVNQMGVLHGIRACIVPMRAAGGGSIVNNSSVLGLAAFAGIPGYVASKFAVRGLSRVAALELAPDRIRVNCLCPGSVDTRMLRLGDQDRLEDVAAQVPLGAVAEPDQIAGAVLYLLSDDSDYVTGTDLVVDGGITAHLSMDLSRRGRRR